MYVVFGDTRVLKEYSAVLKKEEVFFSEGLVPKYQCYDPKAVQWSFSALKSSCPLTATR